MPPNKRKQPAKPSLTDADTPGERRDIIYHLVPNAKRQKKEDPYDTSQLEAAAKKAAKAEDAQELKALGRNPRENLRDDGHRTGLRNLGAPHLTEPCPCAAC